MLFCRMLTGLLTAFLASQSQIALCAEDVYPSKPVRLVVPFSAGSTADIVGRVLSERLSSRLKQPFIVDNRAGAGGEVGTSAVGKAAADGYTLLLTTSSPLVINPSLSKNILYDVEKDFAPIALLAWLPAVLVSNPTVVPAKTLPDLIAFLKANPGKYGYASSGQGSYAHITMELFKQATGVDVTHIPYKGPSQAETDLVGGQVAIMFDGIATANPLINTGRLRAYGVTSRVRTSFAPDIPTFAEQGQVELKSFEVTSWVSLLAPVNTPPAIIARLNNEINEALKTPEFKERLTSKSLMTYESSNPREITTLIKTEKARWAKVIIDAKIQVE